MNFIRRQICASGHKKRGSNHAHHSTSRKWKTGSDALLIPLCPACHDEIHHSGMGQAEFFKKHGINLNRLIRQLHETFIRENNLVWDQTRHPSFEDLLSAFNLAARYEESKRVNHRYAWESSPKRFIPIEERAELWQ